MGDEVTKPNGHETDLARRVDRRVELEKQILELKDELKAHVAEDKSDGFNDKVIKRCVREKLASAARLVDQLTFEAELTTYRRASDLPTTIDEAHARAKVEADKVPGNERAAANDA